MSVKSWNVTYKYKRNSYSSDSKETITIFANSSKDALKDADLKLKNKFFSYSILRVSEIKEERKNKDYKDVATIVYAANDKLSEYNIGIFALGLVLIILSSVIILIGLIGILYRTMVPPPEEAELLTIYNSIVIISMSLLIIGPATLVGSIFLLKKKAKKYRCK